MSDIMYIKVPNKFFKNKYFHVEETNLRLFLSKMKGWVQDDHHVFFADDIDIEATIKMHCGDNRIVFKDGLYDIFLPLYVFMERERFTSVSDLYEWMEDYVPGLYRQHIKFDKENNE